MKEEMKASGINYDFVNDLISKIKKSPLSAYNDLKSEYTLSKVFEGSVVGNKHREYTLIKICEAFDLLALHGNGGNKHALVSGIAILDKIQKEIAPNLARFRIVLIDETHQWTDEKMVEKTGKIWASYLYDENRKVNYCELVPSYELTYLRSVAENEVSEEINDILLTEGAGDNPIKIEHCMSIDAIKWDYKFFCGEPVDAECGDYDEMAQAEIEYHNANWQIDLPRQPDVSMLLNAMEQDIYALELKNAVLAAEAAGMQLNSPSLKMITNELKRIRFSDDLDLDTIKSLEIPKLIEAARTDLAELIESNKVRDSTLPVPNS